jgi:hypothetical protein
MTGDSDEAVDWAMTLSGRVARAANAWERAAANNDAATDRRLVVEVIQSAVPVPVAGVHSFDVRLRADRERLNLLAKRLVGIARSAALLFPEEAA